MTEPNEPVMSNSGSPASGKLCRIMLGGQGVPFHHQLRTRNSATLVKFRKGNWSVTTLFVIVGLIAIVAAVYFVLPASKSGLEDVLTHRVTRGDLIVTVTEQGALESSENTEIKCKVRGSNTITWVIEGGSQVKKGQELLKLDTLALDEAINERIKFAHLTRSSAERLKANLRAAELAVDEYLQGRYRSELMNLEKELAVAKSNLQKTQDLEAFTRNQEKKGFSNRLALEQLGISVDQSKQAVAAKLREIEVLKKFTKAEELETLKGNLASARASYAAESERAKADVMRRDRAQQELEYCKVVAPRDGLVIYPNAARWKNTPDIEEGASVHKDQVLLLMPDLTQMQVKVGVHESVIDRVKKGQVAKVSLSKKELTAKVSSVARVTKPAGWWTGNVVKYDTVIKLPEDDGLKPGMSAEVEIILAEHRNVITVPVAAVLETELGAFCWVKNAAKIEKRLIALGDSNDIFVVVTAGISEGEDVVLNPLAYIDQAQTEALKPKVNRDKEMDSEEAKEEETKEDTHSENANDQAKP